MTDYTPGRWHDPLARDRTAATLQQQYGLPRTWYRKSVVPGLERDLYAEECYITCACVFPLGHNLAGVLDSATWGLIVWFPGVEHILVIASAEDSAAWVDQQLARGARAYYIDDRGRVYTWSAPVPEPEPEPVLVPRSSRPGKKGIDHELVAEDIRRGTITDREIAERYSISKTMVGVIRKKFKIPSFNLRRNQFG